ALPVEAISGVRITVLLCSSSEENFIEQSLSVEFLELHMKMNVNTLTFDQIGQTETIIGNVNPVFSRRCYVPYCFENSQKLQCVINQVDGISERFTSMIAKVECILGEVLSRGGFIKLPLFSNEGMSFLHLETHEKKLSGQAVRLQFKGHSLHTPSSGCPLNAYFMMYLVPEGATKLLLYKSEAIAEKNPVDKLIGKCTTSFDQLLRGVGALNAYKLSSLEGKKKGNASVELVNIIQVASSSFIDYLKTGTQIHFSVAVDFTASNGNPLDPSSLHYIHPHKFNPYMTALNAVTSVIGKYNRHGRIAALGFGAQTPPDYKNGDATDPHVDGIDGVLNAYRSALLSIRPYAPTDYSEVIYHTYKFGAAVQRQGKSDHYFVLLIVTDGCVTNSKRTVNAIVDCAELPISIVIVGVGNQDFSAMQCLLSPTLKSSEGRLLRREIVTFVPYTASMTSNELVTKLLINVPRQFLTWAMMHDRFASSR
ncbi:unnamed protein product, partial [Onchocerca ochengi]